MTLTDAHFADAGRIIRLGGACGMPDGEIAAQVLDTLGAPSYEQAI